MDIMNGIFLHHHHQHLLTLFYLVELTITSCDFFFFFFRLICFKYIIEFNTYTYTSIWYCVISVLSAVCYTYLLMGLDFEFYT